jgi:acetolactate synthase-1/2/3 large subunit
MYSMRGADIVIRLLERQGIDTIFGIPGGAILPIYDALSHSKIRHILARHEQGAGFMAQGIARSTGKTAVFFATSGPGATNAITAFADARFDSVPLVCITGQVASSLLGTDAFQEVDTYGISAPVAKHNFLVRDAKELLTTIPEAFRIAASGRHGPVLVDIPRDVQLQVVEFDEWPEPGHADPLFIASANENLEHAVRDINKSQKPVLMVGGGVVSSDAAPLAREFAEKMGIPLTMSLLGLGSLAPDHPLYLGMIGMHGARYTNMLLDECDLLIVAGARLDDRATGKAGLFCPNARIIHIDIDPSEHGKIHTPHIDIVGDVKLVLEYLLENTQPQTRNSRLPWLDKVKKLRSEYPLQAKGSDDVRTPYGIVKKTAEILGTEAIVVTDVGQHQMRTAQVYPLANPRNWLSSGGLGTMGFGVPAAIGASVANPDRTVVCFTGDGSLFMNIQELATAAEHNVNVKIILANNCGLGLIHQLQELVFKSNFFGWNYAHHVDFIRIAEGFGLYAIDLSSAPDPQAALKDALTRPGPVFIHLAVEASENVYPIVPPGSGNTTMIGD